MLRLLTVLPAEDNETARKLPFLCAEAFRTKRPQFLDKVVPQLPLLLSFLTNGELDATLAGYFEAAVSALLEHCPDRVLDALAVQNACPRLLMALHLPALTELVRTLLTADSHLHLRLGLVRGVLVSLASPVSARNAAGVLTTLLEEPKPEYLAELSAVYTVQSLVQNMHALEATVFEASARVFKAVLKHLDPAQTEPLCVDVTTLLLQLLRLPPEFAETTSKRKTCVMGLHKLVAVELLVQFASRSMPQVHETMAKAYLTSVFVELLVQHEWHSVFHNLVCEYCALVLEHGSPELVNDLLYQSQLPQSLAKLGTATTHRAVGFMGHVVKVANLLVSHADQNNNFKDFLEADPLWQQFCQEYLDVQNGLHARNLADQLQSAPPQFEQLLGSVAITSSRFSSYFKGKQPEPLPVDLGEPIEEIEDPFIDFDDENFDLDSPNEDEEDSHDSPRNYSSVTFWKITVTTEDVDPLD